MYDLVNYIIAKCSKRQTMRTYANFKKYERMRLTVIAKTSRCYHRRSIRYDTGRTQYQCKRHYPVLLLFDSFQAPPKENSLELVVKFINLNYNVLVTASAKRQRMQS